MPPRPPTSTLFPTRRSSDLSGSAPRRSPPRRDPLHRDECELLPHRRGDRRGTARRSALRSEEHTSELQSRQYLVCRLLLEKKKKDARSKEAQSWSRHTDDCC